MPVVTLNGHRCELPAGTTILEAARGLGIEVPTLCHDDRLKPEGGCRLCVVAVRGWDRFPAACHTAVLDGMEIETHAAGVESVRRTLLSELAADYPASAVAAEPDRPFHRWLRHYGVGAGAGAKRPGEFRDLGHPYLQADLAQCILCHRCVRICGELEGRDIWRAWHRGDATRIRPGQAASLRESGCSSCGACADTCPTGAIADRTVREHGAPEAWTRTVCPYCGVGCELNVGTRGGRIVQVEPVPDAPVSRGHLCVKGRYAFGYVQAPDRVTEPLLRRGGRWEPVGWDEALGEVARRLAEIRDRHGPDSIGVLSSARGTNEENYLAQKFARVVLGTNNVDCCARVCHAPTAAAMKSMLGTGAATNSFADIELARGFLLCGTNPTENHPVVGARIRQAVRAGARLVVIDPRETELARLATVHLAPRPGTNVPLLNALAAALVEEGLVDAYAVARRADGWPEFAEFLRSQSPERLGPVCGVDPARIRAAARVYAAARPAMIFHGLGVTEHRQGTAGVMALVNLALLTGNLGVPGAGVNPLRGQNNVQGAAHMGCDPRSLTGLVGLGEGSARFTAAWGRPPPERPGLDLMEMMDAAAAGSLRALWAIGYDVAHTNPDHAATVRALGRLDFVVVQDLFLNEVAREHGSVFLPAAASYERDGTFMNSERRVQLLRPALPPPGAARPDWEILCEVARRMGQGPQFAFQSAREVWDEIRSVWPAGRGITYDRLERGGLQWPCPTEDHPGTALLHADSFSGRPRAPLRRLDYEPSDEVTSADHPFLLTTGRTLHQFNAGTMTGRTPNAELRPEDLLEVSPADAGRLGLRDGDRVRVVSRHGEAELPVAVRDALQPGQLFATFHSAATGLNNVIGPGRDALAHTPEYKVTAVRLERI